MPPPDQAVVQAVLNFALEKSRRNREGEPATYIPDLALVPLERTSAAVTLTSGETLHAGDALSHEFTFQSSAKLLTLIGLLEERGPVEVFNIVGSEPSGDSFGSVARLETHGPMPANPLINSGAIALCGQLHGTVERRVAWLRGWAERLYGRPIQIDEQVLANERASADRNRAIAYFLKHGGVLEGDVDETLDVYFALCSLTGGVREAAFLPAILAHGGLRPGTPERLLSKQTVAIVVSIMATCGMYNESGNYQWRHCRGRPGHCRRCGCQPALERQGRQRARAPHLARAVAPARLALRLGGGAQFLVLLSHIVPSVILSSLVAAFVGGAYP
jgi:glutaminase